MRTVRRILVILLATSAGVCWDQAQDFTLDENCVVSVLNRSARVQADGRWKIDNVPANFGLVRVRATRVKDGITTSGVSDYVNLEASIENGFAGFFVGSAARTPSRLAVSAGATALSSVGATVDLTVVATYPDGSTKNVRSPSEGTSYTVSNPTVATIDPNGLVTAVSSGIVLVSALNDGAVGILQLRVSFSGTDSDGDGIPDDVEITNGMNPSDPIDAKDDSDRDGLTNFEEVIDLGTNRLVADSDADGISDGDEVLGNLGQITNPLLTDTDGDLINDLLEFQTGTDPTNNASFNFAAALQSFNVTPLRFVLTVNTIVGEASRQLAVTGVLRDGSTVDLAPTTRGTNYTSSDLLVVNFGSPAGMVFAGNDGVANVTVTNGSFSATVEITVRSSTPSTQGFVSIPGFANNVDVSGNYAYVAAGSTGLQVVDVSDKRAPRVVAALDTPGNANDVRIVGNLAYVADGASGLQIISIVNPLAPVLVGFVDTPGTAFDIAAAGATCYVADGSGGLQVVDVSLPATPRIIANFRTLGVAVGVDTFGLIAAVAEGTAGLQILSIADPAVPLLLGSVSGGNARDVAVRDSFAYIADASRSFTVVDLVDLRNPRVVASTPNATGGLLNDVELDGRFALGADFFFFNGIPIIDIKTPNSPIPRAILDFRAFGDENGTGLALDGSYVYLTGDRSSTEHGTTGNSRLYIGQYLALSDDRGIAPTVQILEPPSGALVIQGETITVEVRAEDDVGLANVQLFANGTLVGSDTVAPYEFTYTAPTQSGQVILTATATDFGANSTTSAASLVEIIPDPGTTVTGRIVDENGQPVFGARAAVFDTFFALSDAGGNFRISGVPTIRGTFIVRATHQVGNDVLSGQSLRFAAVPNGTVDVGVITIRAGQNQGLEFIVAFQQNNSTSTLSLFLSSEEPTPGVVEVPGLGFSQNFTISPGVVTTVSIPSAAAVNVADGVVNSGIHVLADRPISLYGLNRLQATTDAFAGLPVETFGTSYRVMAYSGTGSQLAVVGSEDATILQITPATNSGGRPAGVPYQITINRYQVYQLRGIDVTGTLITSNKPVGVFGGNTCTNVPASAFACDHLCEQMPPTDTWGTEFVTVPLATRLRGDTFRILAHEAGTSVTIQGPAPQTFVLGAGQFREAILTGNNSISSTKPILVAQYSNGSSFDGVTSDPFMMLIPPSDQFLESYTFTTPATGFTANFANIVAPSAIALSGQVTIDGVSIPGAQFTPIGTTGFAGTQRPITLGNHRISAPAQIGIYVYGFASFDSYGYPGGTAVRR